MIAPKWPLIKISFPPAYGPDVGTTGKADPARLKTKDDVSELFATTKLAVFMPTSAGRKVTVKFDALPPFTRAGMPSNANSAAPLPLVTHPVMASELSPELVMAKVRWMASPSFWLPKSAPVSPAAGSSLAMTLPSVPRTVRVCGTKGVLYCLPSL